MVFVSIYVKSRLNYKNVDKIKFELSETYNMGESMPYVNIRVTKEGVTAEQKAELIKGATDLLVKVLGKNPKTTVVVIDEVETDNWGIGGETVTVLRSR